MATAEKQFRDDHEEQSVEIMPSGIETLAAVDRAALDVAVVTAKQYPRSVTRAKREAIDLATRDEETAGACFYSVPRGRKRIEGPSARLAEIMAYSWGNLWADADIVAEDRTHVTAMGTCRDLERNVVIRVRVKRRITDKHGERYGDDMIGVTANAAISIALRNAVFKVIPSSIVAEVYKAAREAWVGDAATLKRKREKAIAWFGEQGMTEAQLYALLEIHGPDDIGEDELITLRGFMTAILDGETTVGALLRRQDESSGGARDLNEALGQDPPEAPPAPEQRVAALRVKIEAAKDEVGLPWTIVYRLTAEALGEEELSGVQKADDWREFFSGLDVGRAEAVWSAIEAERDRRGSVE